MKPFHWPEARSLDAPGCYLVPTAAGSTSAIIERVREADPRVSVTVIDGDCCRSNALLFAEFASKLRFPRYFGHNWDALTDCLNDLDWLPGSGYLIMIEQAELVLAGEDGEFAQFTTILCDAAARWATPDEANPWQDPRPLPFRVVFEVDPLHIEAMRSRFRVAGAVVEECSASEVSAR